MNNEEAVREWNKYIRCQEKGKSRECYLEYGFDCKFLHLRGYPCRCGQIIDWSNEDER